MTLGDDSTAPSLVQLLLFMESECVETFAAGKPIRVQVQPESKRQFCGLFV